MHLPKKKQLHFLAQTYPKRAIRYRTRTKEKSMIMARKSNWDYAFTIENPLSASLSISTII
jgi:hypothetical protein